MSKSALLETVAIHARIQVPILSGVSRLIANHPFLTIVESAPEVRALSSAGITWPRRSYGPVRFPPGPPPTVMLNPRPPTQTGLPRLPAPPFQRAVPTTPMDRTGACVDCFAVRAAFPVIQAGRHPYLPFEACSDFTHVTARWIAQPPKATFVTRLRPDQLLNQAARQLPDQSTTLWVGSSSTGNTRRRGAPNKMG